MYELNELGRASTPLPGVPWRDLSDEEYAAVGAAYDAQFSPDQAGSLRRFFDHRPSDTSERRAPRARAPKEE